MNVLVLNVNSYSPHGFHFLDTKQNIIMEGLFTKLVYVDSNFTMNSVFIACCIVMSHTEKYQFKHVAVFDTSKNVASVNNILEIEKELLSQYMNQKQSLGKKPIYKIESHLLSGKVKLQDDWLDQKRDIIILKISGVWETENECGLTYKFFPIL